VPATRPIALLLLLCIACVVAGCSGGSGSSGAPRKAGDLTTEDANAHPRDAVRDGGTIRWAIDEFPRQWNLNHLDGATVAASTVTAAMMPAAFGTNDRAALELADDYVTAAKVTKTTPQVVTYTLNRKAKWTDGKPITWKDYAAQWKALIPAAQVVTIDGAGHMLPWEQPKTFVDAVVAFLT